ncbi:hypothetical protein [Herbaspirillum lusitanum]|uniref:hypothetical protein n=1 Tax=Herbaspirillum lusitanum TaxID=213312 RepID=UPI0009FF11A1|nr:hypothetical protein [Herbaspirillum lusitanum]
MNDDADDRFGVPDEAFSAAFSSHGNSQVFRAGTYVPTRNEVATLSVERLTMYLIEWLYESPSELIPTRAQIEEVKTILQARPDAESFSQLIRTCSSYSQGQ